MHPSFTADIARERTADLRRAADAWRRGAAGARAALPAHTVAPLGPADDGRIAPSICKDEIA